MIRRIITSVLVLAFFSGIPLGLLATIQGWVDIQCARNQASFLCQVKETGAFSSRTQLWDVRYARIDTRTVRHRRGGPTFEYQIVFDTPAGAGEVLRAETENTDVHAVIQALNGAILTGAPGYQATLVPSVGFWVSIVLLVVFGGLGVLVVVGVWRPRKAPAVAPAATAAQAR